MKFVLYALGALCFAYAVLGEEGAPAASDAELDCYEAGFEVLVAEIRAFPKNLKENCFRKDQLSAETQAAIQKLNESINHLRNRIRIWRRSTSILNAIFNKARAVNALYQVATNIDNILSKSASQEMKDCIKAQIQNITDAINKLYACK